MTLGKRAAGGSIARARACGRGIMAPRQVAALLEENAGTNWQLRHRGGGSSRRLRRPQLLPRARTPDTGQLVRCCSNTSSGPQARTPPFPPASSSPPPQGAQLPAAQGVVGMNSTGVPPGAVAERPPPPAAAAPGSWRADLHHPLHRLEVHPQSRNWYRPPSGSSVLGRPLRSLRAPAVDGAVVQGQAVLPSPGRRKAEA